MFFLGVGLFVAGFFLGGGVVCLFGLRFFVGGVDFCVCFVCLFCVVLPLSVSLLSERCVCGVCVGGGGGGGGVRAYVCFIFFLSFFFFFSSFLYVATGVGREDWEEGRKG